VGGIPYMIGTDASAGGWLVEPSPAALAEALPIARDQAASLAPAARERYLKHFHPDVLTPRLIEIYAEVRLTANFDRPLG
jgi:glycosyltransferase involved in cell wall biosynthesis